ncbi:MAG: cell division protein ZapA [Peptococcaceae bacterium]|jgi:cell division protein ZapA|nr:cell division protein ZapA [Peptococcaceae bacterium]
MPEDATKISIEIYGEKYLVRGDGTPEHIQAIASEVDHKMTLLAGRLPNLSLNHLAVLTALNLADELVKLREEQEELLSLLGEDTFG